jgi:hypothetical protein
VPSFSGFSWRGRSTPTSPEPEKLKMTCRAESRIHTSTIGWSGQVPLKGSKPRREKIAIRDQNGELPSAAPAAKSTRKNTCIFTQVPFGGGPAITKHEEREHVPSRSLLPTLTRLWHAQITLSSDVIRDPEAPSWLAIASAIPSSSIARVVGLSGAGPRKDCRPGDGCLSSSGADTFP